MSMSLVASFLLATFVPLIFGKRRIALLLLCCTAVTLWGFGSGGPARFALARLQTSPRLERPLWKERNAIVVLGVGTVRWTESEVVTTQVPGIPRVAEAARLYLDCKKTKSVCVILTSGGDPSGTGHPEASVMAEELVALGVERADLLVEPKSQNTFQNARFSAELLAAGHFDQVTLVTSGVHLERSRLYFAHFSGEVVPAPADHLQVRLTTLPRSAGFLYFDTAAHEFLGIWRYHVYNRMGWNPPRAL